MDVLICSACGWPMLRDPVKPLPGGRYERKALAQCMLLKLMCPCCKTYNFAVSPDLKPQEFILVICKQCSANLVKYWDGSIIIISDTMLNQLDKMIFDKQIEKIEKIEKVEK